MRTSTVLRRAVGTTLLSAVALATLTNAQPADAATRPEKTSIVAAHQTPVRHRVKTHQSAIDALGSRVDKLAHKSKMSAAHLKKQLLADDSLEVAEDGTLQVGDSLGGTGATITTGSSTALIWDTSSTFALHSRSSSPKKIYLDFTGHTTTGTPWNTQYGASFTTPVWSRDASAGFSSAEHAAIQQAFASVAEDFAPFDVDVTTQDPGVEGLRKTTTTDTAYGIRVVVGADTWMHVTNSGYAKFYSFDWNTDTPAYCFTRDYTPTKQIAECISHEAGHTVGLFHDGTTAGVEYYAGHGNWAPIMGNSYGKAMTHWSKGQYSGANNTQDDLYVIGGYLGWVPDDVVGTSATTATLPAGTTRSGRLTWGSGEYDAYKFSLTTTRRVNLQSWEGYQMVDTNLNLRLQLTDSSGSRVLYTNSPGGTTRTNMTVTLAPGTYYVFLDGVGEGTASTGYTNYASMGFYNVLLQFV